VIGRPLQRLRRGSATRILWSFGDQAVSSGTNFLLTILVARSVSAPEFGAFAIGMSVYLVCLTLGRSAVSETVVLGLGRAEGFIATEAAAGLRATLVLSAGASSIVACAAALVPDAGASLILLVLAIGLPGLLVQDYRRTVFFALRQPRRAFLSDSLWAGLQVGGVIAATATGVRSPAVLLGIWAASGLAAGLLWPSVTRGWRRERGLSWLRNRRALVLPLAGEGLLFQLGNQSSVFLLGLLAGLSEAGGYRGAQSLFGPVIVLMLGLRTAMLPELMRMSRHAPDRALSLANRVTFGASLFAALWGTTLLALPDSVGRQLLGSTWVAAGAIIWLVTVEKACSAIGWGAILRLRILVRPGVSFLLRITSTVASVLVACIGAPLDGARGVAIGSAIVSLPLAVAWVAAVRFVRRAPDSSRKVPSSAAAHSSLVEEAPGA
jgi:O-antigen/teichoic acid export membrane protein